MRSPEEIAALDCGEFAGGNRQDGDAERIAGSRRGFIVTMVRSLPQGWVWASFGDVAIIESNLVDPAAYQDSPHIAPNHIESWTGKLLEYTTIAEDKVFSSKHTFRSGQILYSKIRPYLAKAVLVDFSGLCSADMYPIAALINPAYLHRWLISPEFTELASRNQGRTVLPKINQPALQKLTIPVPPLNEQYRIVAKIEALKARSQRVKEELEAIAPLLDQFRQSVLAAAFRGDLTADWREKNPDVEPASVLLERIRAERRRRWEEAELEKMKAQGKTPKDDKWKEKYKEPSIPDITDLPSLVNGWAYTFLEPLLSTKRAGLKTGPFGSLLKKHEHRDKGIPVLGIENISSMGFVEGNKIYIDEEKAIDLADYNAKEGDVLISRSGTVGEVCVVPPELGEARISTNLIRVCLVENGMLPEFFCFLFRGSPFILSQISELCSGSTRDFLNQTILNSLVFPLPPLEEQREIVQRINAVFDFSKKIENQVSEQTNSLNWLERSILAKAFRGELVPQDPNDEPAAVLLERIRAEQEKLDTKKKAKGKTEKKSRKAQPEAAEPEQLSLPGFE